MAGFLQGACSVNERPGAFAEFLVVPWDLVWKIPNVMSVEEAAGVSLVALTAAQAIWFRLGLLAPFAYDGGAAEHAPVEWARTPENGAEELNFFIYGASTSVGLYAAQMVRLSAQTSGKRISLYGAASKARWPMLRSEPYGYDHLVDYRDADWPEQIKKLSGGAGMQYIYDCVSEGRSVEQAYSILADGGKCAIVRSREGGAWTAKELPVEPVYGAVWEGLGEEVEYQGFTIERSPAARQFAVEFYRWLGEAVGEVLRLVPYRLMPGCLERVVEDGFRLLGSGGMEKREVRREEEFMRPVSAEKIVYRIQ